MIPHTCSFSFFFFNDTATTEIYTLSLHDALPISRHPGLPDHGELYRSEGQAAHHGARGTDGGAAAARDRPPGWHPGSRSRERGRSLRLPLGVGAGAQARRALRATQTAGGVTEPPPR